MDPLSLTASILAVVGVGAETVRLLRTLASLKTSPLLALSLNNELNDLRLQVLAIQNLYSRQSFILHSTNDVQENGSMASAVNSLQRGKDLVLRLDRVLGPLLHYMLRSDVTSWKKGMRWGRKEKEIAHLKDEVRDIRSSLSVMLGILDLNTSLRLEAIALDMCNGTSKTRNHRARIDGRSSSNCLRQRRFMRPTGTIFEQEPQGKETQSREDLNVIFENHNKNHTPDASGHTSQSSVVSTTITTTITSPLHKPITLHCNCSCHERNLFRSPRATDRIIGTLFAGYLGIPFSYRRCNELSCIRSCAGSPISISLTYFFPLWFLSEAITLSVQQNIWGLEYNLRVNHCVSFTSAIFQYAYQGNTSGIKSILKARSGSPFDIASGTQRSLLGVAASRGHKEICEILLHAGADPHFADNKKRSAVDIAWESHLAKNKAEGTVECLLSFSSLENFVTKYQMGPLHQSVLGSAGTNMQELLKCSHNFAIDQKDSRGQTALYWAALRGDMQAVSYLLAAGAAINMKTNHESGILTAALISNNVPCIETIMKSGCEVNYTDADGYTPLHHCCRHGLNTAIIESLLKSGNDKNGTTKLGHSALMLATYNKKTAAAKFLIDQEVDLNTQGKDGGSAIHYAVMVGDHDTVRYLLTRQANHRCKTNSNETILHFAAQRNGDYELLRVLESFDLSGIDVEARSKPKMLTALQTAEALREVNRHWWERFKELIARIKLRSLMVEKD